VLRHGDSGVHVFFVLSGLVVYLNVTQFAPLDLKFIGRFVRAARCVSTPRTGRRSR